MMNAPSFVDVTMGSTPGHDTMCPSEDAALNHNSFVKKVGKLVHSLYKPCSLWVMPCLPYRTVKGLHCFSPRNNTSQKADGNNNAPGKGGS